jgi:hypothetical protein
MLSGVPDGDSKEGLMFEWEFQEAVEEIGVEMAAAARAGDRVEAEALFVELVGLMEQQNEEVVA